MQVLHAAKLSQLRSIRSSNISVTEVLRRRSPISTTQTRTPACWCRGGVDLSSLTSFSSISLDAEPLWWRRTTGSLMISLWREQCSCWFAVIFPLLRRRVITIITFVVLIRTFIGSLHQKAPTSADWIHCRDVTHHDLLVIRPEAAQKSFSRSLGDKSRSLFSLCLTLLVRIEPTDNHWAYWENYLVIRILFDFI